MATVLISEKPPVAPRLAAFNTLVASDALPNPADATSYAAPVNSAVLACPFNSRESFFKFATNSLELPPNDLNFASAKFCLDSTWKPAVKLVTLPSTNVSGATALFKAAPNAVTPPAAPLAARPVLLIPFAAAGSFPCNLPTSFSSANMRLANFSKSLKPLTFTSISTGALAIPIPVSYP